MVFADRSTAGKLLADRLEPYRDADAVVFALPRGGVPVGYEIAKTLGFPLDIIPVRKIGHQNAPEYAIGAVDDRGEMILDQVGERIDPRWLRAEAERERDEARRRARVYRRDRQRLDPKGKIAIVVDDGVATGLTMRLAVRSLRSRYPERIVIAVPVASAEAVEHLKRAGAEVIVLEPPEDFAGAVGAHYADFPQMNDEQVIDLLGKI